MAVNGEQNWTIRKYSLQTDLYLVEKALLPSSNDHLKNQVRLKTHGLHNGFFLHQIIYELWKLSSPWIRSSSQKHPWLLSFFRNWLCYKAVYHTIFQNVIWWNAMPFPMDHMQPKKALKLYVTDLLWLILGQIILKHFLFQHVQTVSVPKCHCNLSISLVDQNSKFKKLY